MEPTTTPPVESISLEFNDTDSPAEQLSKQLLSSSDVSIPKTEVLHKSLSKALDPILKRSTRNKYGRRQQVRTIQWILLTLTQNGAEDITAAELESIIIHLGHHNKWRRNPTSQDPFGLRRSIGEMLGSQGLKLTNYELKGTTHYELKPARRDFGGLDKSKRSQKTFKTHQVYDIHYNRLNPNDDNDIYHTLTSISYYDEKNESVGTVIDTATLQRHAKGEITIEEIFAALPYEPRTTDTD